MPRPRLNVSIPLSNLFSNETGVDSSLRRRAVRSEYGGAVAGRRAPGCAGRCFRAGGLRAGIVRRSGARAGHCRQGAPGRQRRIALAGRGAPHAARSRFGAGRPARDRDGGSWPAALAGTAAAAVAGHRRRGA